MKKNIKKETNRELIKRFFRENPVFQDRDISVKDLHMLMNQRGYEIKYTIVNPLIHEMSKNLDKLLIKNTRRGFYMFTMNEYTKKNVEAVIEVNSGDIASVIANTLYKELKEILKDPKNVDKILTQSLGA